ncbi:transposase [Sphingomonas lycopersici]|uniref:transposase n=1 Tax=Sphingomonas lycopersici TaxID=2951807 RepID=UPI003D79E160
MEILGRERRRHWSDAEKLEILAAVGLNGETLARVARRYDVSRSQIYNWRGQFKKRGLLPVPVGPTFVPVDIGAPMLNAEPARGEPPRRGGQSADEICRTDPARDCVR